MATTRVGSGAAPLGNRSSQAQLEAVIYALQYDFAERGSVERLHCHRGAARCHRCTKRQQLYARLCREGSMKPLRAAPLEQRQRKAPARYHDDAEEQRDRSPRRRGKKAARAGKQAAARPGKETARPSRRAEGPRVELIDMRGVQRAREFLARVGGGPLRWYAEAQLPRAAVASYCAVRDRRDTYDAFSAALAKDPQRHAAKVALKQRIQQLHSDLIGRRRQRLDEAAADAAERWVEVLLVHPSEWISVPALSALGIPDARIHAAQPYAYAKSCGRGIAVHDCRLGELPWRLRAERCAPVGSVFADLTCGWGTEARRELRDVLLHSETAPCWVLSLTLSGTRKSGERQVDCNRAVEDYVGALAAHRGYAIVQRSYQPFRCGGAAMHYWGWLLQKL